MEKKEALKILVEVALVAQARGVLSLDDAVLVKSAIDAIKDEIGIEESGEDS